MTDELKKALESAHTEEEKKAVVEKFRDEMKELSAAELEGVAGGETIIDLNWGQYNGAIGPYKG